MSMITAAQWVPRGVAAQFPEKYDFDEAEFDRIAEIAKLQVEGATEDLAEAQNVEGAEEAAPEGEGAADGVADEKKKKKKDKKEKREKKGKQDDSMVTDEDLKEYDLEHYDDDDVENTVSGQPLSMFGSTKSLTFYESNKEDPYIQIPDDEDEDEDREDLQVLATDNMLLAARVEDDLAHLVVHVYEDNESNLYVHHDIMLPAIPLCMEWLDIAVQKEGVDQDTRANFVAIGTMDPGIEIWDLDTVDRIYPNAILGQANSAEGLRETRKKKKKKPKANDEYHVDAVLALAANRNHRNLLASGSADKTVKLWDLHTTKCAKSYSYHQDKVCSLAWHSVEATVLLSGSYDRTVVAADMRAPDAKVPRWRVESDVETVKWDPHNPNYFFVSTENGMVHYHDARNAPRDITATKPVWTLQAHDESVSSFDLNSVIPGFMATGSTDKTVKIWNIQPTGPTMVVSRNLDVGKVFTTSFAPDPEVAFRLAVAGSRGTMHVWDTSTNAAVRKAFAGRVPEGDVQEERLVGVEEESSDSSEGEDGDDDEGDSDDNVMSGDAMDED